MTAPDSRRASNHYFQAFVISGIGHQLCDFVHSHVCLFKT
jgi:hypothetical protein